MSGGAGRKGEEQEHVEESHQRIKDGMSQSILRTIEF